MTQIIRFYEGSDFMNFTRRCQVFENIFAYFGEKKKSDNVLKVFLDNKKYL